MTSNLLMGYTDQQAWGSTLTAPAAATGYLAANIEGGSRSKHYKRATAGTTSIWEYDLYADQAITYIYIARADLVRLSDSAASTIALRGATSSAFTTGETVSHTFNIADLLGPKNEDFIYTFTTTARRFWRITLTTTASFQHELSKILFGSFFDMGRDPIYEQLYQERDWKPGRQERETQSRFNLTWRGVTQDTKKSLIWSPLWDMDVCPIFLYDPNDYILNGQKLLHCNIKSHRINAISTNNFEVQLEFEELI